MSDVLARLKAKRPLTAQYDVVIDPDAVATRVAAQAARDRAERIGSGLAEAETALADATTAAEDAVVTLHFQALPRAPYERLMLLHPANEADVKRGRTYDVDGFLPALIAATLVEPDGQAPALAAEHLDPAGGYGDDVRLPGRVASVDEVRALLADWNQGEVAAVWSQAVAVCEQTRNTTLPFGSRPTRG